MFAIVVTTRLRGCFWLQVYNSLMQPFTINFRSSQYSLSLNQIAIHSEIFTLTMDCKQPVKLFSRENYYNCWERNFYKMDANSDIQTTVSKDWRHIKKYLNTVDIQIGNVTSQLNHNKIREETFFQSAKYLLTTRYRCISSAIASFLLSSSTTTAFHAERTLLYSHRNPPMLR